MNKTIITIRDALIVVIFLFIVVRVIMMCLSSDNGLRYLAYQGVKTAAWLSLFVFLLNFTLQRRFTMMPAQIQKMKKVTFLTMMACLLRAIVSIVYLWPILSYKVWPSVHNVLEIAIWLMLALFFYKYWRR